MDYFDLGEHSVLRLEEISKSYSSRQIFRNLSHHFGYGIFAIQGPNGIGKSTLLALLSGAQSLDAGDVRIEEFSLTRQPLAAKSRLSYVPDECPIYPFMTGMHFLEFVCAAKKSKLDKNILAIVDGFGLAPYLDTRFDAMSLGTQKKFMLSAAWIGEPVVMLIDEPSNALDISAKNLLADLFKERQQRCVILFSTHDADFVTATGASVVQLAELIKGATELIA